MYLRHSLSLFLTGCHLQPLSGREALKLHAEVEALMAREGLTYKAAARQLYYAEVAKIESEIISLNAFQDIRDSVDKQE